MVGECIQDVTHEPAETVREQMHAMRRRMVLDLEWFLSQRLADGPAAASPVAADPAEDVVHGILASGRPDEGQQPW